MSTSRLEATRPLLAWASDHFAFPLPAARAALVHGVAGNLAGGTHHAFPDHGEAYCLFNDVEVAVALLRREGRARRPCA